MTRSTHDADIDPDAVLGGAHDAVYRWPEWFSGFSCDVAVDGVEGRSWTRLDVRVDEPLHVDLDAIPANDRAWVGDQLSSMISHRAPLSYADGDGRYPKALVDGPIPNQRVVALADGRNSRYHVENGEIARIERMIAGQQLVIVIQSRMDAPVGRIAARTSVAVLDGETGRILAVEIIQDAHLPLGDVLVPASRRSILIEDGSPPMTRELRLLAHSAERVELAS